MPARVVVLFGGPDAERPVSIQSGTAVAEALRTLGRHEVVPVLIDRLDAEGVRALRPDVVFPVLHGRWGEGGPLQEVLEQAEVAYVGSRPRPSALAMDKLATKLIATGAGIPTPRAQVIGPGDACDLAPPLVLKPVDDGSSVDLRICRSADEVAAALPELLARRERLLAERFVQGREVTAGFVLGEVLPLIEIRAAGGVYDYDAKYLRDDTEYRLDPALDPGVAEAIRDASRRIVERLGCRDLARVDFMVDAEGPWFLEVNTIPGFTSHSLVPKAARHLGVEMPELCGRLVDHALRRGGAPAATLGLHAPARSNR